MNASIHLRTNALQGVPGASAVVRGKVAAGSVAPAAASLASRAEKVAAVAAAHAAAVDRDARFPAEAIAMARASGCSASWCRRTGRRGASIADVVDVCYTLGRACSSTGMIYAMHQVKVACIMRHGMDSAWHRGFMRRMLHEQLLLASSTTEGKGGGNVRTSEAPRGACDGRASCWCATPASSPMARRPMPS